MQSYQIDVQAFIDNTDGYRYDKVAEVIGKCEGTSEEAITHCYDAVLNAVKYDWSCVAFEAYEKDE